MAKKTIIKEKDLAILVMIHRLKLVILGTNLSDGIGLNEEARSRNMEPAVYLCTRARMCVGFNGSY